MRPRIICRIGSGKDTDREQADGEQRGKKEAVYAKAEARCELFPCVSAVFKASAKGPGHFLVYNDILFGRRFLWRFFRRLLRENRAAKRRRKNCG